MASWSYGKAIVGLQPAVKTTGAYLSQAVNLLLEVSNEASSVLLLKVLLQQVAALLLQRHTR